jgi:hypothetical protein
MTKMVLRCTVPALPECNIKARRMGDLIKKIKEAMVAHMKAEMGMENPGLIRNLS